MLRRLFLSLACFAAVMQPLAFVQAAEPALPAMSAEAAVKGYVDNLVTRIREVKPLYASDRAAYLTAVGEALTGFVDFNEVARGVMAKYGNSATPEQMQRFAEVFKASLVDFYGSSLADYSAADYTIVAATEVPENPVSATPVKMDFKTASGTLSVEYTMFVNVNSEWKLKNLFIDGINMRRQYYAQFDSMMLSNNNDIDKVIAQWAVGQ
ncbi:MAG: ABC transporter substrate-binding protein [Pseudomonadota bacterium]